MARPSFQDAVFEAFFVGGYGAAVQNGRLDAGLFHDNERFFRSMDRGAPLVAFCHFVDTYFGDRNRFIGSLSNVALGPIVRMLYYARNAFIHCAWDVSKLANKDQAAKLREFSNTGGYRFDDGTVFAMTIDENNMLQVSDLMAVCMRIARNLND